jgi:hypothetical protein
MLANVEQVLHEINSLPEQRELERMNLANGIKRILQQCAELAVTG